MIRLFLSSLAVTSVASAAQPLKNPFETLNKKWLAKKFSNTSMASTEGNDFLDVSVLVDQNCWIKNKHPQSLMEQIKIETVESAEQSFHVRLDRQIQKDLMQDACVIGVGNHGKLSLHDADPMSKDQKHLGIIGATEFADDLLGNRIRSQVTLAIIDTGLDLNHPEFTDLWVNEVEANGTPDVDDDKNGYVDDVHGYNFVDKSGNPAHRTTNDHGSHVAGLAAANLGNGIGGAGVMGKNIRLMVLNVVGTHWDEVDLNDVERAIRYAADNGADVINLSSGGAGEFPTLSAAVTYAVNKGVTVVVSAGNTKANIDEDFTSPASYAKDIPGLIAVSATDTNGGSQCSFSNFGPKNIKVSAPGCDTTAPKAGLLSTLRNSTYGYKKGTSMAAPLVSGAVALIYASLRDKGIKPVPAEVEKILKESSTNGVLDLKKLRARL